MIELQHVTKTYNSGRSREFAALRDVSVAVVPRQITVFRGPSGSGKTTLLSLIGCMARPTSGRIWVMGREVTSLPEKFLAGVRRKTFGVVFQNYHLMRGIAVLENVMLPAYPDGPDRRRLKSRAMDLLARLRVESKAGERVENLSGGEQQRTAIARALINDPAVLIADEPTAHLDSELSGEFMEIVRDLNGDGKTLLLASHDPLVAESPIVHRVIAMRDGRIAGADPAHDA
jgi:putative ABC transport system ATP-binding protein